MLCPNCGGTVADVHTYCTYCGCKLAKLPVRVEDSLRKELRENLESSASQRSKTDMRISPVWVVVSFIIALSVMIVGVIVVAIEVSEALREWDRTEGYPPDYGFYEEPLIVSLGLLGLIPYVVLAALTYCLVSRGKKHFARESRLRDALTKFTERTTGIRVSGGLTIGAEASRRPLPWSIVVIAPSAMSVAALPVMYDYSSTASILAALLLALLSLVFLVLRLYLLCFLTKDMARHHDRWRDLTMTTKQELARMGYTAGQLRTPYPLPDRSMAVYVVATIFTAGFFEYYWWYAIIKDGNEHFEEQRVFEDQLIALLHRRPPSHEPSPSGVIQTA